MSYAPYPEPDRAVLDLGLLYSVVVDSEAVDFDLASTSEYAYRQPPLAATNGYRVDMAEFQVMGRRDLLFTDGAPLNPGDRLEGFEWGRVLDLRMTPTPWDVVPSQDTLPQPYSSSTTDPLNLGLEAMMWDANLRVDPRSGTGSQAWDVQAPKDIPEVQAFNVPPTHDITDPHEAADSILNWQVPPPVEGGQEQDSTLNLNLSPYTGPGNMVVDFELVPEGILVEAEIPTRSVDAQPNYPSWSLKQALDGVTIHPWDRKPRLGTEIEFPSTVEPNLPPTEPPDEPEIKRTYIIMNSSSLIEVTTNTPLEFKDLNIEQDADSFAWTMSCTILNRASMDQIRPSAAGPAEVEATINGHQWRFIIESYRLDKRFARETYQVSGVSRSQLLAAPYAPKSTGRITSQTTATQAMTEQLQFTGFTVSRQQGLTDYIIPAGAWGWDNKTPMEVISELAAAQGAIVVPDRDQDVLHIRHRYKLIAPWDYPGLPIESVDAIIADAMTTSYASQWDPQPEYNAVFVSGITDGVAADVIRQGTAGDLAAPDIFDDLNVDSAQCRERGLTAIAASGNQEIVTVETILPTSGSPGLIEPAMLAESRDTREGTNTWRGNVLGVSISVSKPGTAQVTQAVKIERHHY